MRSIMYWLMIILALTGVLAISACHTVHGFGEDLQSAGHAISGASSNANKPEEPAPQAQPQTQAYPNSHGY